MGEKKRWGDRKDGVLLRDLDSMHFITPLLYPNRCDNEAYVSQRVELTQLDEYIASKNAAQPEVPYTMFHAIVAATMRAITLRPKMNRFIANKNMYLRNELTASFVVKKQFKDSGAEALAFLHTAPEDTMDTLHDKIAAQILSGRSEKADASTESMDLFNKMPRFLSKFLVAIVRRLDVHGWVPRSLIASDPYYSTVVFSNVGSIGLQSGYHHLTNWGTNSIFMLIGKADVTPVYQPDGSFRMVRTVDLGLTVDERLADGYYYSKTVRLLRFLVDNPEYLERPLSEPVDYEQKAVV